MPSADRKPPARFWSPERRSRWTMFGLLGATASIFAGLTAWSDRHALLVNASTSLPNWAFMLDRERLPVRGDHVFFEPPPSVLLQRHFGRDPQPFGKIVYGVAGDRIERRGRMFLVNGKPVALAKPMSRRGEPLALGPTGVLPRGCYFVATPNPDSFDSRYAAIGWICRARVVGVGEAIL